MPTTSKKYTLSSHDESVMKVLAYHIRVHNSSRPRDSEKLLETLRGINKLTAMQIWEAQQWFDKTIKEQLVIDEMFTGMSAAQHKLHSQAIRMTPAHAYVLLQHNKHNRNISLDDLKRVITWIRDGKWDHAHPEAIVMHDDYNLGTGQHRCLACLVTGETLGVYLTTGASAASRINIDTNKQRAGNDIMEVNNVADSDHTHATVRLLEDIKFNGRTRITIQTYDIMPVLARYPNVHESVKLGARLYRGIHDSFKESRPTEERKRFPGFSQAAGAAACYLIKQRSKFADTLFEPFYEVLMTGNSPLGPKDPARVLHQAILRGDVQKNVDGYPAVHTAASIILGWNAYTQNQKKLSGSLHWHSDIFPPVA
jgi:hypothetical protein